MRGRPPAKLQDACAQLFAVGPDGTLRIERLNVPLGGQPLRTAGDRR
jgi:hypothetical protein